MDDLGNCSECKGKNITVSDCEACELIFCHDCMNNHTKWEHDDWCKACGKYPEDCECDEL
jgi:hypothetical protein